MRNRLRILLALITAVIMSATIVAEFPANADPDELTKAKKELVKIEAESAKLDDELIAANVKLSDATKKLGELRTDIAEQKKKVAAAKTNLSRLALHQYQNSGISTTAQLLGADDTASFFSSLAAMDNMTRRTNESLQTVQLEQGKLTKLEDDEIAAVETAKAERAKIVKLAKEYDAKEAAAKAVVDRLTAEQRARLEAARQAEIDRIQREHDRNQANSTSRSEDDRPAAAEEQPEVDLGPGSSRAAQAAKLAAGKAGSRYRHGSAGPNVFDCSGLSTWAFKQVGISLPRTARAQSNAGRGVSLSQIQPGDLVFYYYPVSHVGIYIGGGKIIHAANPRRGTRVAPLRSMPINKVRRVG